MSSSSGIKRGLATAAVSALAVTGLPFLAGTAHAETLSESVASANTVFLATFQDTSVVSTKNDGQNTTFRLEAIGGANVAQVRFEYTVGGGPVRTIDTVSRNDNGAFMTEWAPAGNDGTALQVYAVAIDSAGNEIIGSTDSQTVTLNNAAETVNINEGSQLGVFQQPYRTEGQEADLARITGTASNGAQITLGYLDDTTEVENGTAQAPADGGAWTGSVNLDGYDYAPAGGTDQVLITADNGQTDDTEAFALYKQQITTVTATGAPAQGPAGSSYPVTVTVTDQNGNPVVGAQVFSSKGAGPQYTDERGRATFTQAAGGQNDAYYYANTTDNDAYEQGTDPRSETVVIGSYVAQPTSLDGNSENGPVFDFDEYEANDIYVQVEDQQGASYDTTGQTLEYYWVFTPVGGGDSVRSDADPVAAGNQNSTVLLEEDGRYNVPLTDQGTGTYELFAGLRQTAGGEGAIAISKVLTVQAGESEIVFNQESPEQANIGGSETINGRLVLVDEKNENEPTNIGLPNRPLTATVTGGTALFDQATGADQGTRSTTTDANGNFSFTLDDPDTSKDRSDSTVTVVTDPWNDEGGDPNDADESNSQDVDFESSTAPGSVVISGGDDTPERPGELETYTVTVRSQDDPNTAGDQSVLLTNQQVTLTTTNGYFTDGNEDQSAGSDAGQFDNDGQSITVTTDGSGQATFSIAIGRDAGFDDDGDVNGTITATAGNASDTEVQEWTSENPINGGEVDIDIAGVGQNPFVTGNNAPEDAAQQGANSVKLVVRTFDQFGNRVGGERVSLSSSGVGSVRAVNPAPTEPATNPPTTDASVLITDYDAQADATATSSDPGQQTVTASWTTEQSQYQDADDNPNTAPTLENGFETLTDSQVINWYTQVATEETATLDDNTGGDAEVGETVTMTVRVVDQHGQAIQGYAVEFIRSGPGQQSGDTNERRTTNAQGVATYNFTGTDEGTANITAVVRDRTDTQVATLEDTVVFGEDAPPPPPLYEVILTGDSNGKADDELQANAPKRAAGDVAKLFKYRKNGELKLMAKQPLNKKGNYNFRVIDTNGKKFLRYVVRVTRADGSKVQSNDHRVR